MGEGFVKEIEIQGLNELAARLRRYPESLWGKEGKRIVRISMNRLRREARAVAPMYKPGKYIQQDYRTGRRGAGHYKSSIRVGVRALLTAGILRGRMYSRDPLAHLLEAGHKTRLGTGRGAQKEDGRAYTRAFRTMQTTLRTQAQTISDEVISNVNALLDDLFGEGS